MNRLQRMMDNDMRAVQRELGEDVDWNGKTYEGIPGEVSEGAALRMEGYDPDTSIAITFRRSDFKNGLPASGDRMITDGTSYMVDSKTKLPGKASFICNCVVP
ncbi:MAG TPA: hypothetical protein VJ904_11910 [Tichowtungia sp.]|nr:hypothetical protein [Tichowtungia sp.]